LEEILLLEEEKLEKNRIGVNWNSFIKIKKKNYLEDYVFIKEIGRGAYGSVQKIKMKYGGLFRAAKVIKSALINADKANTGKLFAEISVPIKLDHPNLVKLYEVFEWRAQYILVMELCEGGDLFNNIKQSRFFT
jgi:calcium-dependent protein kinase